MSQTPTFPAQEPGRDGAAGPGPATAARRRAASVTLRQDGVRAAAATDLMDPANKSLADALRIAYRLLMVAIAVMVGLYFLSGFQTVQTNERGVRTVFGRITQEDLPQGFTMSWPQPIGGLEKVSTSEQRVEINKPFFPNLSETEEKTMVEKGEQGLAGSGTDTVDPNVDGQLLTGDGFIVHTRWQVTYRRTQGAQSLKTIADDRAADPGAESVERQIVTAAVRRGVVHAAASLTIDEILYGTQTAGRMNIKDAARAQAQAVLDGLRTGLEIQQLNMTAKMPPRRIFPEFNKVQAAQSDAGKAIDDARATANDTLAKAAGQAAPVLLALIDRYEAELGAGKAEQAKATLGTLRDAMMGRPVTIDGKEVRPGVAGQVTAKISEAQNYRTSVVTRAQSDASAFRAKLEAYKSNPRVFLNNEWSDALATYLDRDNVQTMLVPLADTLRLSVNPDPEIARNILQNARQREVDENVKRRREQQLRDIYTKRVTGDTPASP